MSTCNGNITSKAKLGKEPPNKGTTPELLTINLPVYTKEIGRLLLCMHSLECVHTSIRWILSTNHIGEIMFTQKDFDNTISVMKGLKNVHVDIRKAGKFAWDQATNPKNPNTDNWNTYVQASKIKLHANECTLFEHDKALREALKKVYKVHGVTGVITGGITDKKAWKNLTNPKAKRNFKTIMRKHTAKPVAKKEKAPVTAESLARQQLRINELAKANNIETQDILDAMDKLVADRIARELKKQEKKVA